MEPWQFTDTNGEKVVARMSIAGANIHYVRAYDLPPELPDDLPLVLGEFGEIQHVVPKEFPPV